MSNLLEDLGRLAIVAIVARKILVAAFLRRVRVALATGDPGDNEDAEHERHGDGRQQNDQRLARQKSLGGTFGNAASARLQTRSCFDEAPRLLQQRIRILNSIINKDAKSASQSS